MECALSGASKTQVIREFKNRYKLHDNDIEYLLDCCSFKKKPKNPNEIIRITENIMLGSNSN